jgi:hypothetical protein
MANLVSVVQGNQQAAQVSQAAPATQTAESAKTTGKYTAPQDTVTISTAGKAASQASSTSRTQSSGDTDRDGDSK